MPVESRGRCSNRRRGRPAPARRRQSTAQSAKGRVRPASFGAGGPHAWTRLSRCAAERPTSVTVEKMPPRMWITLVVASAASPLRCPSYGMRECAGRGVCEDDGTCSCSEGFSGVDCAVVLRCDPEATRLPCLGRGHCSLQHGCECGPGYSGTLCESDDWCPTDALGRKCSGAGVCASHACLCPSHRSGVACEYGDSSSRDVPVVEER